MFGPFDFGLHAISFWPERLDMPMNRCNAPRAREVERSTVLLWRGGIRSFHFLLFYLPTLLERRGWNVLTRIFVGSLVARWMERRRGEKHKNGGSPRLPQAFGK